MASVNDQEVAKTVNSLLCLTCKDQQSRLGMIEEYFTYPSDLSDSEYSDSDDDDCDSEAGSYIFLGGDKENIEIERGEISSNKQN